MVAIWQSKFFIRGVSKDQQSEIRESLASAVTSSQRNGYALSAWTLCVPEHMDAPTTKWWDGWKKKQESALTIEIDLWDKTVLETMLISPDAAHVRAEYFGRIGHVPPPAPEQLELPTLPLPPDVLYDEMLFIKQLRAARMAEVESAKRQFFNAEIMSREVTDKGVPEEVAALQTALADVHAIWETRFNRHCVESADTDHLPGLYPDVMQAIEDHHHETPRSVRLPMGLVHRMGTMHQVVDDGQAGWVRSFRAVAAQHLEANRVS